MSAYIVSNPTMHRAVAALVGAGLPASEATALGRKLWAMNAAAVEARYPEDHEELGTREAWLEAATWRWDPTTDTSANPDYGHGWPGDAWDSLGEVQYQCAEGNVPDLPLFKMIAAALKRHEKDAKPEAPKAVITTRQWRDPGAPRRRRQQQLQRRAPDVLDHLDF